MSKTVKSLLTALLLVILASMLLISASAAGNKISTFAVDADSAETALDLGAAHWYPSYDGNYYIFLPTGTDRTNLKVWFSAESDVLCNGIKLTNGETTDVFAEGDNFVLTCGSASYNVKVMQADSIGTIYVNTESGNMTAVHADKEHKEPGSILILNKDGEVQYDGVLDYIKGRGNSTWLSDKKPYNIKLDKKEDLFGMGKHKSWCLLSNPGDPTLIKNQLCYDFARNLGVTVTSETFQVNLYLNGEYAGVYLITEKVGIDENRIEIYNLESETEDVNDKDLDEYKLAGKQNSRELGSIKYAEIPNNPDEITGGYLLETEKIYRYVNEPSGFISDIGQCIVVKSPEFASKAQVEYISSYYQDFEDALYSRTGYNSKGMHYSEYIDVETLARMYIMLEFASSFDGCSSSFYLYKDVDGKLTAGPAWDFDLSLGHNQPNDLINHVPNVSDPNLLYIQTCFIGNHAENKKSLLGQAFTHNDFQEKVEQIWAENFEAYYPTFCNNIEIYKNEIQSAYIMNAIRWNNFGTTDQNKISNHFNSNMDSITNFVNARYPFIQQAFNNDTYFVKYDIGEYGKTLVHDQTIYVSGGTATVLAAPESTKNNEVFGFWSTNPDGTGETFTVGDQFTVTENINLYAQWINTDTIAKLITAVKNIFIKFAEFLIRVFS